MTAGELGAVRSTHHVDNDRRRRIGSWGLGIGAISGLLSVIVARRSEDPGPYQPGQGQIEGAVYGLALSAVIIGVIFLWKSYSHNDEYFEVHEFGLVHATSRGRQTYPWTEIAYIRVRTKRTDPISHYFGSQFWAAIAITGRRRKLKFTGLTEQYRALAAAIMANCPPAPRKTVRQRLTWLGVAMASAATFAYLVNYVTTHPDTEPGIELVIVMSGFVITSVLTITALILFWRKE